jgi:hypothetical protein
MTAGPTGTQQLIDQVRSDAAGGPYVVAERPYGFDLTIDIADARWYTLIRKNRLKRVFTHEVRVDEADHTIAITDVENRVRWGAGSTTNGGLSLHAERSMQRGRIYSRSFHKEFGVDAHTGEAGAVVDYTFSSGEGRELVREAAERAGWREKMGREQRGALVFGLLTIAVLVVAGLVALVIQLSR